MALQRLKNSPSPPRHFKNSVPTLGNLSESSRFSPRASTSLRTRLAISTIPDSKRIFDKFCVLSLTHLVDGFITTLALIVLDVFTSIDTGAGDASDSLGYFMEHLLWRKPRHMS